MAHDSQLSSFAAAISAFPGHFSGRVLDVGSYDINGGPHHLFTAAEYVGVDLVPGPNVTLVSRGQDLDFPDHYFDVTMSSECFEHNEAWPLTLQNMIRMTRPSGLVIFTAASTGRLEHGTRRSDGGWAFPGITAIEGDWYRNLNRSVVLKAVAEAPLDFAGVNIDKASSDLCFIGLVTSATPGDLESADRVISQHLALTGGNAFPGSRVRRLAIEVCGDASLRLVNSLRRATRRVSGIISLTDGKHGGG